MNQKQKIARQRWMASYENHLVARVPAFAGKVDWDTAAYFFNQGQDATDAAERMAKRYEEHDGALG